MTEIDFKIKDGRCWLKAEGHSGDPVLCAAISAIIQTAFLGLENLAEQHPDRMTVKTEIH